MITLQKAIESNNTLKVKLALKNGEDPNQQIEDFINSLFFAISQKASFQTIKLLIENGVDINETTQEGVGILDEAIILGDIEFIEYLLLRKKFNPNKTKRKSNFTPLMQAASYGVIDIAKLLLKYGADIMYKDNVQLNAIDYAKKLQQKKMQAFLKEASEL